LARPTRPISAVSKAPGISATWCSPSADPGLVPALLALVEPDERGDPVPPLRWTAQSTRALAAELTRQGHEVSADTVGDLLRAEGFSLQGNAKTIEGKQHPDRDAQFRYISEQARATLGKISDVLGRGGSIAP
jgi:hypothetical protein